MSYFINLENIAYGKATAGMNSFSKNLTPDKAVDMRPFTSFSTTTGIPSWIRVDLSDSYFVHEVLIQARVNCCGQKRLHNFDLRVGKQILDWISFLG